MNMGEETAQGDALRLHGGSCTLGFTQNYSADVFEPFALLLEVLHRIRDVRLISSNTRFGRAFIE